jgi:hypothetical protein
MIVEKLIFKIPYEIAPPAFAYLLDDVTGATSGYSICRKLRSAYSGSAIRVRRSSDNAEQDIGFVNNILDTASLLTFVGANDGFVTTIYDQQASNNRTQGTATFQPKIVTSGSLETLNGKPCAKFDGVNDFMQSVRLLNNANFISAMIGATWDLSNSTGINLSQSSGPIAQPDRLLFYPTRTSGGRLVGMQVGSFFDKTGTPDTNQHYYGFYKNGTSGEINFDNLAVASGTLTSSAPENFPTQLGARTSFSNYASLLFQEDVFYNNATTSRTDLRTNMNDFYGAF